MVNFLSAEGQIYLFRNVTSLFLLWAP